MLNASYVSAWSYAVSDSWQSRSRPAGGRGRTRRGTAALATRSTHLTARNRKQAREASMPIEASLAWIAPSTRLQRRGRSCSNPWVGKRWHPSDLWRLGWTLSTLQHVHRYSFWHYLHVGNWVQRWTNLRRPPVVQNVVKTVKCPPFWCVNHLYLLVWIGMTVIRDRHSPELLLIIS